MIANHIIRPPKACKTCESALSRAGNAQSQSLYESYARLQQLRGLPTAIPAGTAAASEATSKVVGIIESLLRSNAGNVAAKADIGTAMGILKVRQAPESNDTCSLNEPLTLSSSWQAWISFLVHA